MGQKTITGKIAMSKDDYSKLTVLAKEGVTSRGEIRKLQDNVQYYRERYYDSATALETMKNRYNELKEKCKPYLEAMEHFPELVRSFVDKVKERLLSKKHRNKPKKKQRKKQDRSVSRLVKISVVWKDKRFDYTHDFMTS